MKDYFDLFQLEPGFVLDHTRLDTHYRNLQSRFHPDRFVNGSSQQQQLAARTSADLNLGYKILKDPITRARHLLSLHQGRESLNDNSHDEQLLMLQMQRNEDLESAASISDIKQLEGQVREDIGVTESHLAESFRHKSLSHEQLVRSSALIQKLQFFTRLLDKIDDKKDQL